MSRQQYIPIKDLKQHYTIWVEAPSDPAQTVQSAPKSVQIKEILNDKIDKGKQYYRVVWADRPAEEASWVEKERLENSETLLAHYANTKKRKRHSTRQFQTAHAMTHMIADSQTLERQRWIWTISKICLANAYSLYKGDLTKISIFYPTLASIQTNTL